MSEKCSKSQCFLCYKKGYTAQFCLGKSVNLASIEDETNLNYIKGILKKMGENLLSPRPKYNLIQDMFQQRAEITYGQLLQYTPIKVYTRIKGNAILAILDTGACMSVVTKLLVVALGLR